MSGVAALPAAHMTVRAGMRSSPMNTASSVMFVMLNESKPPFDNIKARQALAHAVDFEEANAILNAGIVTQATGPFAPGNIGHLEDSGFPTFDLDEAKRLVEEYEAETGLPFEFTYTTTNAGPTIRQAQLLKEQVADAGMSVEVTPTKKIPSNRGSRDVSAR